MSFLKNLFKATRKYLKRKKNRFCTAVIVAAGSASRMQGTDKIMALLDGKPVICHTIEVFQQCSSVQRIVIVTRADLLETMGEVCRKYGFTKVCAIVQGGADRPESVSLGIAAAPEETTHIAIHDGARPFITVPIIEETLSKAFQTGAAAPAVPVKDTIKIAQSGLVSETPDRAMLYAVQTPQIFDIDLLRGALQHARDKGIAITDDCSAVEKYGMSVHLVMGAEENIKITTPLDLAVAEVIVRQRGEGL